MTLREVTKRLGIRGLDILATTHNYARHCDHIILEGGVHIEVPEDTRKEVLIWGPQPLRQVVTNVLLDYSEDTPLYIYADDIPLDTFEGFISKMATMRVWQDAVRKVNYYLAPKPQEDEDNDEEEHI